MLERDLDVEVAERGGQGQIGHVAMVATVPGPGESGLGHEGSASPLSDSNRRPSLYKSDALAN